MKIIQPQELTYTVELTQIEIDVIAHALGTSSQAAHIKAMPHYKQKLEGLNGLSGILYEEFTQYVSRESRTTIPHFC